MGPGVGLRADRRLLQRRTRGAGPRGAAEILLLIGRTMALAAENLLLIVRTMALAAEILFRVQLRVPGSAARSWRRLEAAAAALRLRQLDRAIARRIDLGMRA